MRDSLCFFFDRRSLTRAQPPHASQRERERERETENTRFGLFLNGPKNEIEDWTI